MACLVVLLLTTTCAQWQWGRGWTPGVRAVAQQVTGVCLGSVSLVLLASGVWAAVQGRGGDEGST
jgi:hypothetical protein